MIQKVKDRILFSMSQISPRLAKIKELSKLQKIVLAALSTFVLCILLVIIVGQNQGWWIQMNSTSILHMSQYEDENFILEEPDKTILFDAAFPFHGFTILLNKIVVNLRSSDRHPNPMGSFKISINLSTQVASAEVKEKEAEIMDAIQRNIETLTYEQSRKQGNILLKSKIKQAINIILRSGRVTKVYIKSAVLRS